MDMPASGVRLCCADRLPSERFRFLFAVGSPLAGHHVKFPDMTAAAGGSVCVGFIQKSTNSRRAPLCDSRAHFSMSSRL